ENAAEVVQLLEAYEAPLYISGHLHAQRIKKHLSEPGADPESCSIWEIVLSPYSLPPCQYGVLAWSEADDMIFDTRTVPVADYAREQGSEDTFLLEFDQKGPEFLKNVISSQVMNSIYSVPDDLKRQMADLYADLYFDYCAGNRISRQEIRAEKAYRLWERAEPDNRYMAEMGQMMEDVRSAMHDWKNKIEKGENDGSSCFGE
ncbi:MAG: metallophosphoesterase, partial [Clostridium sp.]|nr:metallophosphoesterase [Clostridium sp.]